jgi:hypothetical protein
VAKPFVLWESVFDQYTAGGGNISATGGATGTDGDNISNWRLGSDGNVADRLVWASPAASPEYVTVDLGAAILATPDMGIIAGHNLGTVLTGNVTFQYDISGAGFVNLHSAITVTDNEPIMAPVTSSGTARYFRLRIQGTFSAAPEIGIITLGRKLEFSEGVPESIDPYGVAPFVDWPKHLGSPTGTNVRGKRKNFNIDWADPGLHRDDFFSPSSGMTFDGSGGFTEHAVEKGNPFWFSWNSDDTVDPGPYLCRTRKVQSPPVGSWKRRNVSCVFEGFA